MTTETTTASDSIGGGRGGRMSRQRKRDAVLRLLRGGGVVCAERATVRVARTRATKPVRVIAQS